MATMLWSPDVLPGWEAADLGAPASATAGRGDGPLTRTLVRCATPPAQPRGILLLVHGYNDYFFSTVLADAVAPLGWVAYGVDMRRAGRSLRKGNQPHHIDAIEELGEDIADAARAAMADAASRGLGDLPLVVHAHSTGALATAIWAADRPDPALAGVVLDGPFFGLVLSRGQRLLMKATPALARLRPRMVVDPAPSPYTEGLLRRGWVFDTAWKAPGGVGATAGWLAATRAAQARAARGLGIGVPVLVASSDSSGPDRLDNPRHASQDTVVDVDATGRIAPLLGDRVEHVVIPGGIHDLLLSAEEPRAAYLAAVADHLTAVEPGRPLSSGSSPAVHPDATH